MDFPMEIGKSFPSFSVFIMNSNIKLVCSLDIQMKLITSKWRGGKFQVQNIMSEFFGGFKAPIWVKTTDLLLSSLWILISCLPVG